MALQIRQGLNAIFSLYLLHDSDTKYGHLTDVATVLRRYYRASPLRQLIIQLNVRRGYKNPTGHSRKITLEPNKLLFSQHRHVSSHCHLTSATLIQSKHEPLRPSIAQTVPYWKSDRMRELIQLQLPKVVEARKKRESMHMDLPLPPSETSHTLNASQSSTSSDVPSPVTPTFSARCHSRLPSSTSSLASSPPMRDSMDGFAVGKRPLTEVREEPLERDGDYEMLEGSSDSQTDCNGTLWPLQA